MILNNLHKFRRLVSTNRYGLTTTIILMKMMYSKANIQIHIIGFPEDSMQKIAMCNILSFSSRETDRTMITNSLWSVKNYHGYNFRTLNKIQSSKSMSVRCQLKQCVAYNVANSKHS